MVIKETFSLLLLHRRSELNYTQQEVAHGCGISVRAYQSLEKGEALPEFLNALRLSVILNFSLDSFKSEVKDVVFPIPRKK